MVSIKQLFSRDKLTFSKVLPYIFIVCGMIGMLASFMLTYEKIHSIENPGYKPACSINPIISCESAMSSPYASINGMPDSVFGLIAFTALAVFGVLLASGAEFKRWIWVCAQIAVVGGLIFAKALIIYSLFFLGKICPWCATVWVSTIMVFWGVTVFNLREGNFGRPQGKLLKGLVDFVLKNSVPILLFWYGLILLTILVRFWDFWISQL
jgi:uncharacterized membrane protein